MGWGETEFMGLKTGSQINKHILTKIHFSFCKAQVKILTQDTREARAGSACSELFICCRGNAVRRKGSEISFVITKLGGDPRITANIRIHALEGS